MAIEIKTLSNLQPQATEHGKGAGGANSAPTGTPAENSKASNPSDRVSLTDTAQRLSTLADQVSKLPAVDTQRVNAVKAAIADGSFTIDANRVAAKFIRFENALTDIG